MNNVFEQKETTSMNDMKLPSAVQVVSPDFTLYPDTHKHLFVPVRLSLTFNIMNITTF